MIALKQFESGSDEPASWTWGTSPPSRRCFVNAGLPTVTLQSPVPTPPPPSVDATSAQGSESAQIPASDAVVVAISNEAMHALEEREAERAPLTDTDQTEEEIEDRQAPPVPSEPLKLSPGRTPEESLDHAERALRQARVMTDPSPGDLWTATRATAMEFSARAELSAAQAPENPVDSPDSEAMQRRVEKTYAA